MSTDPFCMLPKIVPFYLLFFFFFFGETALGRKFDSSWKRVKVLELVDLIFLHSQWGILWFLLSFWLRLWMIQPLKQSQRQEISPLNPLKRLLLSERYSEPPGAWAVVPPPEQCFGFLLNTSSTFTAWVLTLLVFLRQCVQHSGSLAPHRSWPEDCCWTANVITG